MKQSWIIGLHAVSAVLQTKPEKALQLIVLEKEIKPTVQTIIEQAKQFQIAVSYQGRDYFKKHFTHQQHQGVALLSKLDAEKNEKALSDFIVTLSNKKTPLLLILDQVQDPHNLGACLRTADAAGVDALILPKDNACPLTETVHKVACGATQTMTVFRVANLVRVIKKLKESGIWVIGTSDKAKINLYQQDLTMPLALVMGAEGKGLRPLTEKNCDQTVSLPMAGSIVSSLNVSVATGVCLYEIQRQRN